MLPRDYFATVEGYNNKQRKKAELIRQHAFITVSPYLKEGTGYEGFKNVFPLWFDEIIDEKIPELTEEKLKQLQQQHKRFFNKK